MSSHYDVLGAPRTASAEELRRAYRHAVKASHPDTGGTAEAFARVQDAWADLGNPTGRRAYDARNPGSHAGDASPATSPAGGPTVARSRPGTAPGNVDQPDSARTRPATRRTFLILCASGATVSGAATTLVTAGLGRPGAAAAVLHMTATGALAARRMAGKTTGEGTYRGLVRGAWILAVGLALIALLGWAMHHSPWPVLLWSACVALYAASLSALWRTLDRDVT